MVGSDYPSCKEVPSIMQIKGIGSDIVAVSRIERAMARHPEQFLSTLFTPLEIEYCQRHQEAVRHFAGRFAAKEAVAKALGTGFRGGLGWLDIEIENDAFGKPHVRLSERALPLAQSGEFHLTISHCREYATATAVWVICGRGAEAES